MTQTPSHDDRNLRLIRLHSDYLRRGGGSARTIQDRDLLLRRLATFLPCALTDASPADLDRWQASITGALSTVANYSSHARMFYRWLLDNGHIETDPAARLPRPKLTAGKPRPIPERHLQAALDASTEPVRTWLLLAGYMGLRAHEIAKMRREDIAETEQGRLLMSGVGKGRRPFQLIVPMDVDPYLRPHLTSAGGPLWWIDPYPTVRYSRRPARRADVTNAVTALMRSIDLPYTTHTLRHRFGTRLYAAEKDLLLVQDAMRHANPAQTRLYIETSNAQAAAAMDRLSASLRPKSASRRRKPARTEREAA